MGDTIVGYDVTNITGKLFMTRDYAFGGLNYEPNPYVFTEEELEKVKLNYSPLWDVQAVYKREVFWEVVE